MTATIEPTDDRRATAAGHSPRRSGTVPTLWWIAGSVLFAGALTFGAYQVLTLLAHEERTGTTSYPAAGIATIDVASETGAVSIVAADTDEVTVETRISDGLRPTGEDQRVVGETLELRATCPNFGSDWCSVDYLVRVPPDVAVVVRTDDGRVRIEGTTGPVDVDGDDGSVLLSDLAGPVRAATDSGRVEGTGLRSPTVTADSDDGRVTLTFAAAPQTVVATTENGAVEVVVPADGTAYRLDVDTDDGETIEDVPIDSSSARSITLRTDSGRATARTS